MSKLKLLELFGGIGACSKALERIGIDYEIVDYVEIDKYAVASYNAIHNTNFEPQDITTWDKNIEVDLIMHGSPCQDISTAGLQRGADEGSGTRSSLMYETLRIVNKLKPKYVIWENVKNLIGKNHIHNFNKYIDQMSGGGYTSFYKVLNAVDYGIPQHRERVFTISIRNDVLKDFEFPKKQELKLKVKDLLLDEVDEKYYLSEKAIQGRLNTNYQKYKLEENLMNDKEVHPTILARFEGASTLYSCGGTKLQQKVCNEAIKNNLVEPNDVIEFTFSNSRLKEIEKGTIKKQNKENNEIMSTLVTKPDKLGITVEVKPKLIGGIGDKKSNNGTQYYQQDRIYDNDVSLSLTTTANPYYPDKQYRIRRLIPLETWLLMGFDKEDFEKAQKVNKDSQLYKQAGNSIVVNVLEAILKELLK